VRRYLGAIGHCKNAQEAIGEVKLGGDRCVTQLTTLLQRIEGRSVLRLMSFATAEQQRYPAFRLGLGYVDEGLN
jgi:hypothetical protein